MAAADLLSRNANPTEEADRSAPCFSLAARPISARDGQSTTMALPSLIAFTERSVFGGTIATKPDRPHDLRTVMG
jgi:hypothetical protein